ncbi:helix-turn-helix domain-containing protein, partial [Microbispora rosea]
MPAETTVRRLVDAAERLFAERGIDAVSLREINAAAGQRNSTALHVTGRYFEDCEEAEPNREGTRRGVAAF